MAGTHPPVNDLPPGYYGDQWRLFEIHCKDFREAARYAADQGWWLHCWDWVESDITPLTVVVVGEPDPPWEPVAK